MYYFTTLIHNIYFTICWNSLGKLFRTKKSIICTCLINPGSPTINSIKYLSEIFLSNLSTRINKPWSRMPYILRHGIWYSQQYSWSLTCSLTFHHSNIKPSESFLTLSTFQTISSSLSTVCYYHCCQIVCFQGRFSKHPFQSTLYCSHPAFYSEAVDISLSDLQTDANYISVSSIGSHDDKINSRSNQLNNNTFSGMM